MAVYTEISDADLVHLIAQYDIGELHSLKGVAEGVENTNYILRTDKGLFMLTLYEKRVNPDDLPFFLGLMDHLAAKGVNCPRPIPLKSGATLSEVSGRPCAIISFLDGHSVKKSLPDHCGQLGKTLAEFHLLGQGFQIYRENALTLKDWRPLYEMAEGRADEVAPQLSELIETELNFLEKAWPKALPSGVIHADLFPDNVFFLKGELSGLIDFYFACNDLFAYDLAVCINAWCFEADFSFNVTKASALINGYQKIRPLSVEEIEALPVLCRGSALRFLLTRLYDWLNVPPNALVVPKDPGEYITKLKFHRRVISASEYGVEI